MNNDERFMRDALVISRNARRIAPPNPWVGSVIVRGEDVIAEGATAAPGGAHAEIAALSRAGDLARGATLYSTLEPCDHEGRTGSCVSAIVAAGISRVVIAISDPDKQVSGRGIERLTREGIEVTVGVLDDEVTRELSSYVWHRQHGRPFVTAKVASTLDGIVAMADGSSQWITSEAARADAHELRADSQAIVVGAGTVRSDDPALTARTPHGVFEPLRVVLGRAPDTAKVRPCLERSGDLGVILDELGERGVVNLLVEGGPRTTSAFVNAGLVNKVVWYIAPALAGADGTTGSLVALRTDSIQALRRGTISEVRRIGEDVRVEVDL